jgi:two-component system, OmpR family, phosphate regulon response regulator PhoB
MTKILIVEDQPDIRTLIAMTLEYGNFSLFEAEDGKEGLAMVQRVLPDIVLLDVMMPGELDGYQVCERIKGDERTRAIKVIMLTARGQRADLQAGNDAGSDAYLVKPFSPLQLIETVERLVSGVGSAQAN